MKGAVLPALLLGAALLAAPPVASGREAAQGPSLREQIASAAPGSELYIEGGKYYGAVVIDKPLSLVGVGWPVIDGGGGGDVLTITADDVSVSGFVVRGSSRSISQEPAAIKVKDAHNTTLRANRVEDSHFGIHVTGSHHSTIAENVIDLGSETPIERRGHGIYFWRVAHTSVHGNSIRNAGDGIHLEFSEANGIGENRVVDSRYALHLMYSAGNNVVANTLRDNLAGAVLMFSHDLVVKDNELSGNRRGAMGTGILFKDCDNPFVEGNRITRNKWGMTVEGTPQSAGASAVFLRNLFALNDVGLGLMSNAPITFVENAMVENTVQVKALGGEIMSTVMSTHSATAATGGHGAHGTPATAAEAAEPPHGAAWTVGGRGNYWSDYSGHDGDGDGVGDRPYRPQPPFAGALAANDRLRLFQFTLAQEAIDAAADMFPLYRYKPVIEDAGPLMSPPGPVLERGSALNGGLLALSILLLALAAAVLQAVLDADSFRILGRLSPLRGLRGGV